MNPALSIRLTIFVLITGSFLWPFSAHAQSEGAVAMNNLGVDLAQAGRHQEAVETFENVIRLRPDFANAYYNLGTEYQRTGQLIEAIEAFNKAISLVPCHAGAYNNLGTAYFDRKQYPQAIAAYQRAIACQPTLLIVYRNLGYVYLVSRQKKKAVSVFLQATLMSNDFQAYNDLGIALYLSREYHEAIDAFRRAISIGADEPEARFNLACTYLAIANKEGALREKDVLSQLSPRLARQLYLLIYKDKIVSVADAVDPAGSYHVQNGGTLFSNKR